MAVVTEIMEPWLAIVTIVLCAVPVIFVFGYRFGVSEETRELNRRRFNLWLHSDRRSAKLFRAFWWLLILATILHVILTLSKR